MAIEIRELVVKLNVVKNLQHAGPDYVTKDDIRRIRQEIADDLLDKVRDLLEDSRESR